MTNAQKIELRLSQVKQRLNAISGLEGEAFTDEVRSESDALGKEYADLETRHRAAIIADGTTTTTTETRTVEHGDAEQRERVELRSRASIGRYLMGHARGKVDGAERELCEAAGVPDGTIPLELWTSERRSEQVEQRAITPAPSTVGINLDVLRPAVFAPSVVDKLGVEMPMVESGTYATGTISTLATGDAVAKGADVPETAAAFTVGMTTPHRVGASLNLAAEDIAAVGQANFESVLRQHISLVLSSELDRQMLNGEGANDDLTGILHRLADPAAPSAVAAFDDFVAGFADSVDGLWAGMTSEVSIVCEPATYQLSSKTFREGSDDRGSISFADYARAQYGGWWTNSRMPDAATFLTVDNVQQAILYRRGMMMQPTPMRTAVCPSWGYLTVDDIYTGARKAERRYVISALVGDVILVQPGAYQQVAFKVA